MAIRSSPSPSYGPLSKHRRRKDEDEDNDEDFAAGILAKEPREETEEPPSSYGRNHLNQSRAISSISTGYCHHSYVETGIKVLSDGTSTFCRICLNPKPLEHKKEERKTLP